MKTRDSINNLPIAEVPVTLIGADDLAHLAAELATDLWRPALDTETVFRAELTIDSIPGAVRVISLAVRRADGSEEAFVVDLRDTPAAAVAEVLAQVHTVGWNANFDEHALALSGISVASWYDAMLADAVTRAGHYGVSWYRRLASVTKLVCGEELEGKGSTQLSYDASSDLTADQVTYAARDAVATRRVADWVRSRVTELELDLAVELENGARPFINAMMMRGVPFNFEGYLAEHIAAKEAEIAVHLERLAALTEAKGDETDGVSQTLLDFDFGDEDDDAAFVRPVPSWNPNSKPDLTAALNRWAEAEVRAHTGGRLLTNTDSLRKDDLKRIGGPVVETLLAYKSATKEVSTYGEKLRRFARNGRFFSRYKQAIVSTGRLGSFDFNAQNFSKSMLPWMRPDEGRVLVYGDAGQAELRVVAHLSGDTDMLAAFESGEDFHTATAKSMFPGDDIDALVTSDPATAKKRRTAAKAVNFGITYGMAAGLLSANLTVAGVPTSKEDAQGYLDAYFAARPGMAKWLADRDAYVARVAADLPPLDWESSLRLYELRMRTEQVRRKLKRDAVKAAAGEGVPADPTHLEVAKATWPDGPGTTPLSGEELEAFHATRAAELEWAMSYEGAVVLDTAGRPVGYHSTTASGRRRWFDIPVGRNDTDKFSGVITTALLDMCSTRKPAGRAYVEEFASQHDLTLPSAQIWRTDRLRARSMVMKQFEGANGESLRLELVLGAIAKFGLPAMRAVLDRAAKDCLRSTRNAYRNHPVQGTVADIMEMAFATINAGLPEGAVPVLTVHDSVVIECDAADADGIATLVRDAIEDAMRHFCPSVRPSADVDIRTSLDDGDIISTLEDTEVPQAA